MQKLLVLANLGRVRFLVFKQSGDDPLDKAHLLEGPGSPVEMRPASVHQTVTDQAGRFRQGGASAQGAGMSYGEEYELEEQLESDALKRVAEKIDEIVSVAAYPGWHLVAPSTMLSKLQEALPAPTRHCLTRSEAGDLTKLPLADLEKRFL
jgi:Protein required for attachment to host cells